MKLIFLLIFFPCIIFAQNFKRDGLKENNEKALAVEQTRISILENRKIKIGLGTGKYSINSIKTVIENQNNGNVFYLSLSTPINSHFSTGYIFQFIRQVSKSELEPSFVTDIMYSNALNIECFLFGSQHTFDLGAFAAYGFSSGSYMDPLLNQIVDFSGFMPSFKIFGMMRLHKKIWVSDFDYKSNKNVKKLLKSVTSFKPIEISLGPQIAINKSDRRIRNIWTLSLGTNLDF
tara:strand:- start:2547 stop:3245 length:699 start_codon:yes stop_codon:yes gene_type:complete